MSSGIKGLRTKGIRRPFWSLLRMQFKVEYSPAKLAENIGLDESKRKYGYLYLGLMALAFVPFTVMLFGLANTLSRELISVNQPGLAVVMAVMAAQILVVFFGLSHLMSSLYYSSDLEMLQSFPLTPWQIMYGKIFVVYVGQLVFALIVAGPFLITLGVNLGGVLYWPAALPVFLLIPAVPLAISVLLLVPVMKLTSGTRKRDLFRVLFGLLIFVLVMGFQYLNTNIARHGPEVFIAKLMEKNGLVSAAAGYYPLLKWAAWALTGEDAGRKLLGLFLYSGISIGLLNLVIAFGQRWFLGGIATGAPAASKKPVSRASTKTGAIFAKPKMPLSAMMLRDHRVIVRTPNFFLTVLLNLLILPIIALSLYLSGGHELARFVEMVLGAGARDVVVLAMVGIHGVFTGINQVASTAVSREGQMFWFNKIIPVSPRVQMRAKLAYSTLFALAQLVILGAAGTWLFNLGPARFFILMALGILVSIPVSTICLLNDLYRPKLRWTDPQQAMKSNFQTLVASLFSLLYLGILALVIRGFHLMGVSPAWLYGISGILLAVSSYALLYWLDQVAEAGYARL